MRYLLMICGAIPRYSPSFLDGAPIQSPEILAGDKLDPDPDIIIPGRTLPGDSCQSLFPRICANDMEGLASFGHMFAPYQRAVPAHKNSLSVLFPGAAKFF